MKKIHSILFATILTLIFGNVLAVGTNIKIISKPASSMNNNDIWDFEMFQTEGYGMYFIADQRNEMTGLIDIKADMDSAPVEISVISGNDKSGCNKAILTGGNSIRCVVGLLPNSNSERGTYATIIWNKIPNSKGSHHGTFHNEWL